MTKTKAWVAAATALVTGLSTLPLTELPGWAAGLITAAIGAAGALGVYAVPNKPKPASSINYRDEPYLGDQA